MRLALVLLVIAGPCMEISARQDASSGASYARLGAIAFPGVDVTDVDGWVDPTTGREYAIVGRSGPVDAVIIVDVTDPANPTQVAVAESGPNGETIAGFDVKVYQHYVYSVLGGSSGIGAILDISDPTRPTYVGWFPSAHNITIDPAGYLYASVSGLKVYSLANPTSPELIWSSGLGSGHDATVRGDILYDFRGGGNGVHIYDVTDRSAPDLLGTITGTVNGIVYAHSGWTTVDGKYLYVCDELITGASPDVTIWDVEDPSNPVRVGSFGGADATVHNVHVVGDLAFFSYYTAGLRIYDISVPTDPVLVQEIDSYPATGEGFAGAFGVYAFAPSGNVYVSGADGSGGLLEVVGTGTPTSIEPEPGGGVLTLDVFPRPIRNAATLRIEGAAAGDALTVSIFDLLGRNVGVLYDGVAHGPVSVTWQPDELPAGLYVIRAESGGAVTTRSVPVLSP